MDMHTHTVCVRMQVKRQQDEAAAAFEKERLEQRCVRVCPCSPTYVHTLSLAICLSVGSAKMESQLEDMDDMYFDEDEEDEDD